MVGDDDDDDDEFIIWLCFLYQLLIKGESLVAWIRWETTLVGSGGWAVGEGRDGGRVITVWLVGLVY